MTSQRCRGRTRAGKRCRHRQFTSAYCKQHHQDACTRMLIHVLSGHGQDPETSIIIPHEIREKIVRYYKQAQVQEALVRTTQYSKLDLHQRGRLNLIKTIRNNVHQLYHVHVQPTPQIYKLHHDENNTRLKRMSTTQLYQLKRRLQRCINRLRA